MKIVIVYASAGRGHQTAAEALYFYFKEHFPKHNLTLLNILDYTSRHFSYSYSRGYYLLASHFGYVWSVLYSISSNAAIKSLFSSLCRLHSKKFEQFILTEKPDVIISTHFFPSEVISYLKKRGKLFCRLITVITDFGIHPFWINEDTNEYIVATENTLAQLLERDIAKEKVKVLGIPISQDFSKNYARQNSKFSALLVTGSFGFSFIEKIVKKIVASIALLVVCGNNLALYERLQKAKYLNMQLFGFTKDMPRLMSQVDVVITKPGGLSIAEALAMDLPLLFIQGIPGQEALNSRIIENYGCGIIVENYKALKKILVSLESNSDNLLDRLRANIQKIKKPKATEEICNYVCASSARPAG